MRNERSKAEMYLAIQAFADVLRAERLAERKSRALEAALTKMPAKDFNEYAETTERMRAEAEERVEARA